MSGGEDLFVTQDGEVAVRLTTLPEERGLVLHAWQRNGLFSSFNLRLTKAEAAKLVEALVKGIEEVEKNRFPMRPVSMEPVMAIVRPLHGRARVVRLEPDFPTVTRLTRPKGAE